MTRSDRWVYWLSVVTALFGVIGFPLSFFVAWGGHMLLGFAIFLAAAICIALGTTVGASFKIANIKGVDGL